MNDKILILFEENQKFKKEELSQFVNLSRPDCEILTLEELIKKNNLKDFFSVVDCTFDHKLFNKNKEKGQILKTDNLEYLILSENNKMICKGPNLSQLSTYNSTNEAILEKFKESLNLYNKAIDFLIHKNMFLRNKKSFQEASSNSGIIMNDVIKGNKYKIYKLVYSIPEIKEPNTEYILFDNIEILNTLKNIIDMELV